MSRRLFSTLLGLFLLAWGLSMVGVPGFAPAGTFVAWLLRLWPLLLVAWGAHLTYRGLTRRGAARGQGLVLGLTLVGLGLALLGNTLGAALGWSWATRVSLMAGLLIGAGTGFLLRAVLMP